MTLTHGHSRRGSWSTTYYTWAGMVQRCTNPRVKKFHLYGGRGIKVCDRWRTFENFLVDMNERPVGYSIHRIDSNGDYEPSNCRWATAKDQARERRTNKLNTKDIERIRDIRSCGISQRDIGRYFGISRPMVGYIIRGLQWA